MSWGFFLFNMCVCMILRRLFQTWFSMKVVLELLFWHFCNIFLKNSMFIFPIATASTIEAPTNSWSPLLGKTWKLSQFWKKKITFSLWNYLHYLIKDWITFIYRISFFFYSFTFIIILTLFNQNIHLNLFSFIYIFFI